MPNEAFIGSARHTYAFRQITYPDQSCFVRDGEKFHNCVMPRTKLASSRRVALLGKREKIETRLLLLNENEDIRIFCF